MLQRPPALPGVIFDSDMCVNIDCALALAVLYGAAAKVKVVGLTVTNPDLEGAVYCDVVARFYTTGGKLNNTPLHYYFPIGYEGDGERRSDSTLAKGLNPQSPGWFAGFWHQCERCDRYRSGRCRRPQCVDRAEGWRRAHVLAGRVTNLVRCLALPAISN